MTLRRIFISGSFWLVAACMMASPLAAQAATCSVAVTGVSFGTYDPFAIASNDSTGSINVTCSGPLTQLVAYSITISQGNGTYAARRMVKGSDSLQYNLYVDPQYLNVWGDSLSDSLLLSVSYILTLSPTTRQHTVYGRMPARQTTAAPGLYTDAVAVTVSF